MFGILRSRKRPAKQQINFDMDLDGLVCDGVVWFTADSIVSAVDRLAEEIAEHDPSLLSVAQLQAFAYGVRKCALQAPSKEDS